MNHEESSPTVEEILVTALKWAENRDYSGWDYADGLSSPVARYVNYSNIGKLALQEGIKRFPLNIRPLFCVPQRRSFKGAALFLMANLWTYDCTENPQYLAAATELGNWLLDNQNSESFGWGHNHALQTLSGTIPRNTPSVVTTGFVTEALLALGAYRTIPFLDGLPEQVETFVLEDLAYTRTKHGATISYRKNGKRPPKIVNANALGGKLLCSIAAGCDRPDLLDLAEPLFEYVASEQTAAGGWQYADPPSTSHLSMDPHHNGFILDSFLAFRDVANSDQFNEVISTGFDCFREHLFEPTGAPRWDEKKAYPHDIHAAAQGIITATKIGDFEFATRVIDWTVSSLYHPEGRFGYRVGRYYTRKYTLMRWAQAWMCYALAHYCRTNQSQSSG